MKWTSVKTRVPKSCGPYIVANRLGMWMETCHPSWWNTKDKRGKEFDGPEVTHWMRLPPPPKGRK